jgi:hypothetical protein
VEDHIGFVDIVIALWERDTLKSAEMAGADAVGRGVSEKLLDLGCPLGIYD